MIWLNGSVLQLEGPVLFATIKYNNAIPQGHDLPGIVFLADFHSMVICHNHIHFLNNEINVFLFETNYGNDNNRFVVIKENTFISMNNDNASIVQWYISMSIPLTHHYNIFDNLPCFFQYISQRGNLDNEISYDQHLNFSVEIDNFMQNRYLLNHCRWLPGSAFTAAKPLDVNKRFINNFQLPPKVVCVCSNGGKQDCYVDTLATAYPGQLITVMLSVNKSAIRSSKETEVRSGLFAATSTIENVTKVTVKMNDNEVSPTACRLGNLLSEATQMVYDDQCTTVYYTIVHSTMSYLKWCELFVTVDPNNFEGYYINILSCPVGFVQENEVCICDPILTSALQVTECDINHQTILRPAGSWLSAVTINDSHQYHISPHCPFHYCQPQASQLNFITLGSQCQFNRNGVLCGQCQQGVSTVFGSSQCHHCTNVYLLLAIPIAVAGFVLVLLLFILNLTVTNGDINGFILYVNIISINSHVFFPQYSNSINFWHIFISLTNLDLGIPACFYNGMDDYAKMWLQLAFPAYLIVIATSLIIASRHSTTVQRITARRALPVLATLFLLSYTKVLRTVSSVLFYYSTITHLPSGHTTLVWAVDANVPLFGLKYTALFIVCLVLFIILLPFNAIFCFTKIAVKLQLVSHFKPLIDAYQGPYKFKHYYWTGIQLVMRAVFFGLSALDRNISLTIGITILAAITIVQAKISPFKNEYKNVNELSFLYSLLAIFIFSHQHYDIVIKIMIIIAALQLSLIIIYHTFINLCGEEVICTIKNITDRTVQWITRSHVQNDPQPIELNNTPPDVTFHYTEFLEPLVGLD